MKHQPPGLLRASANPDVIMMACTAGHVDHGKTSLVRLLTGCNTDRLKAERERGMTIELGFAPCFLGGNLCMGIVDVPGHEKFVRTMVAGVSGIDMAILVVAADDGIMPQTVEHFQIMELLGVKQGIVALTKTDLVGPERVGEVADDIRAFLEGTFMAGAPVCPVSPATLAGYDVFYETLLERIRAARARRGGGVFRMPVERVFRREGFGAVATGIPVDGRIAVGDEVEIVPGGGRARVRGIQRFLRDAEEGGGGQCLALNLTEDSHAQVERGMVVATPGCLAAARQFHLNLTVVPGVERPLRNAEPVKFHTGTSEEDGKVYLLEDREYGGGLEGLATVVLARPVAAAPHDRFILRRPSPAATVAGGEILRVEPTDTRRQRKQVLEELARYRDLMRDVDPASGEGASRRMEHALLAAPEPVLGERDLAAEVLLPGEIARGVLKQLVDSGKAFALQGGVFIHADRYGALLGSVEEGIAGAVERGEMTLSVADLRASAGVPAQAWQRVVEDLGRKGVATVQGAKLLPVAAGARLGDADRVLGDRIVALYEEKGFDSPRPEDVPALLGTEAVRVGRLLEHACNEGRLVRLSRLVVLSRTHFRRAQDLVVQTVREKGSVDSGDFKLVIGSSRKYALAILDFLDARRVTIRIGNMRKLAPGYERNLL